MKPGAADVGASPEILKVPDQYLRRRAKEIEVAEFDQEDLTLIYEGMVELADSFEIELAGLAATQVVLTRLSEFTNINLPWYPNVRIFILRQDDEWKPIVNPIITKRSYRTEWELESCASIPNTVVNVKRPWEITLVWASLDGESTTLKEFEGQEARVIQHEIDHLDGILMTDYNDRVEFVMRP